MEPQEFAQAFYRAFALPLSAASLVAAAWPRVEGGYDSDATTAQEEDGAWSGAATVSARALFCDEQEEQEEHRHERASPSFSPVYWEPLAQQALPARYVSPATWHEPLAHQACPSWP